MSNKKNFKKRTPEEKAERVACLMKEVEEGVKSFRDSEKYKAWLKFTAIFHHYSPFNTMLILRQNPKATRVAGFRKWQEVGRKVRKNERGYSILRPNFHVRKVIDEETGEEKEVKYTTFSPTSVFDISQTEGDPVPEICRELDKELDNFDRVFEALVKASSYPVVFDEDLPYNGAFIHDKEIRLKTGLTPSQTVKTLCHELGHSVLHCKDGLDPDASREEKECEAESVAYILCNYLGLDSSDYTFEYVTSWCKGDPKVFQKKLAFIQKAADQLIEAYEKEYDKNEEAA